MTSMKTVLRLMGVIFCLMLLTGCLPKAGGTEGTAMDFNLSPTQLVTVMTPGAYTLAMDNGSGDINFNLNKTTKRYTVDSDKGVFDAMLFPVVDPERLKDTKLTEKDRQAMMKMNNRYLVFIQIGGTISCLVGKKEGDTLLVYDASREALQRIVAQEDLVSKDPRVGFNLEGGLNKALPDPGLNIGIYLKIAEDWPEDNMKVKYTLIRKISS